MELLCKKFSGNALKVVVSKQQIQILPFEAYWDPHSRPRYFPSTIGCFPESGTLRLRRANCIQI